MKSLIIYLTLIAGCFIFEAGCKTAKYHNQTHYNTVISSNYDRFDTIFLGNFQLKDTTYILTLDTLKLTNKCFKIIVQNKYFNPYSIIRTNTVTGAMCFDSLIKNLVILPHEEKYFNVLYVTSCGAFSKSILFFFKEKDIEEEKLMTIVVKGFIEKDEE